MTFEHLDGHVEGREEQVEDEIGYLSPQDILQFCAQRFPFLEQFKGCGILFYIEKNNNIIFTNNYILYHADQNKLVHQHLTRSLPHAKKNKERME